MPSFRTLWSICGQYGWNWMLYRAWLGAKQRLHWEQRSMPLHEWPKVQDELEALHPCLLPSPDNHQLLSGFSGNYPEAMAALREEAEEILSGRFRKFEQPDFNDGFPPIWNEEVPGVVLPGKGTHWSLVRPDQDIKLAWELSRMGWAQILGRAYALLGDDQYAEGFWILFEDWCLKNPPNHGTQWMCGQEAAIRAISLALASSFLRRAPASTPQRMNRLSQVIQATAERIEPHIHYARSQRNNHALNESLGLITAGTWVPSVKGARRWIRKGRTFFAQDLLDQLDEEGSYIQHSTNYHRVMLHACTWRLLLARHSGAPLPLELVQRMKAGFQWLVSMVDPTTGEAPNLGSNDGANVLRLSTCPFSDHRPTLQGLASLLGEPLPYPPGPWDEPVLWLSGCDPATMPRSLNSRSELSASRSGHYLRLFSEGSLYFRCATYHDRPSQSDPLHVDLTWRGLNVLCDAGTYRYNAPAPWGNTLAFTSAHNTVTIDGQPSMRRMGPFLWLDWDEAVIKPTAHPGWLSGERKITRASGISHRRTVFPLGPAHWAVLDDVWSPKPETFRLHWLLPAMHRIEQDRGVTLETEHGSFQLLILGPGLIRHTVSGVPDADRDPCLAPLGWRSPCYSQLVPALSLTCADTDSTKTRWVSIAGVGPFTASIEPEFIRLESASGSFQASLPPPFQEYIHAP